VATYTIAADKLTTDALTLVANTADTVSIVGRASARRPAVVIHPSSPSATTPVWVTFDGSDPDPAQGFAYPLWPGQTGSMEDRGPAQRADGDITVKLKSSAAQVYSVET
jgi:hypothetical protein